MPYNHDVTYSTLIQVLACCHFWRQAITWIDVVLLWIRPLETRFNKIESKYNYLLSRKFVQKCHLKNVSHFVQASFEWIHDDVIKWKHFPLYWPFVRGIHQSPVNSLHKGQWRGALMFSLICVWINGSVNNREAGDLRRYRTHYDVIVMHMMMCFNSVLVLAHYGMYRVDNDEELLHYEKVRAFCTVNSWYNVENETYV